MAFIASGLFGAAMSNSFATGFLYAEGFMKITGKLASVFILGGSLGWAIIPSIAGLVLETYTILFPFIVGTG